MGFMCRSSKFRHEGVGSRSDICLKMMRGERVLIQLKAGRHRPASETLFKRVGENPGNINFIIKHNYTIYEK